jgi:hypothetical protein
MGDLNRLNRRLTRLESLTTCPTCGKPVGVADPAGDHKALLRLATDEELEVLEAASELMERLRERLQGRDVPGPSRVEQILAATREYAEALAAQRPRPEGQPDGRQT